jgi:hypothetical protein
MATRRSKPRRRTRSNPAKAPKKPYEKSWERLTAFRTVVKRPDLMLILDEYAGGALGGRLLLEGSSKARLEAAKHAVRGFAHIEHKGRAGSATFYVPYETGNVLAEVIYRAFEDEIRK